MKKKKHMINSLNNAFNHLEKARSIIDELMGQEPEWGVKCNEYGESEDNLDYDSDYFILYELSIAINYIQDDLKAHIKTLKRRKGE